MWIQIRPAFEMNVENKNCCEQGQERWYEGAASLGQVPRYVKSLWIRITVTWDHHSVLPDPDLANCYLLNINLNLFCQIQP
jgi:hypothetical protein